MFFVFIFDFERHQLLQSSFQSLVFPIFNVDCDSKGPLSSFEERSSYNSRNDPFFWFKNKADLNVVNEKGDSTHDVLL